MKYISIILFLLLEIARIYNIFDNYTEAFKFLVRVSEMSKKVKMFV